ncbi:MAG TPA: acetolactate synthase [Verrucomicrobiae bacterium]
MVTRAMQGRQPDAVTQFSVFTANRMGRLHDLISLLGSNSVHVLAVTVLDTTETAIIRLVVDDPQAARRLLADNGFAFTECQLLVVEIDAATQLPELMAAFLEAEVNVNYMYCFIPHPQGKSILGVSMEDNEVGEKILTQHGFRVLRQADVSR